VIKSHRGKVPITTTHIQNGWFKGQELLVEVGLHRSE
jgi:hypothetical protein